MKKRNKRIKKQTVVGEIRGMKPEKKTKNEGKTITETRKKLKQRKNRKVRCVSVANCW